MFAVWGQRAEKTSLSVFDIVGQNSLFLSFNKFSVVGRKMKPFPCLFVSMFVVHIVNVLKFQILKFLTK